MAAGATDFERLGGEPGVRAIIEDFTARVFGDVMIGFLFEGKPKARITEMEIRFASAHLGAGTPYSGRSIAHAHRASPILGGHFLRRRRILAQTLADHGVPDDIAARWLAHEEGLKGDVLGEGVDPESCDHEVVAERLGPRLGGLLAGGAGSGRGEPEEGP
ncbi:MAG: group 1 truncated hemoglobin [Deltaproteobacteria bacterium]|nr:group 1 truncated hemoglobin [Deltaproteobacteria bacterium]